MSEKRRSPFTGREADPAPVLAVKIDNHKDARPHTGIEEADIVFVERVEGGLSRLMAVFASWVPGEIGPVRSAREHQVEQLAQFGRPILAYSGAQKGVQELINRSALYARPHETFPDAYGRRSEKRAPHNLYLTPDMVLADVPDASVDGDIGWRFGDKPEGGEPTLTYEVEYRPGAKTGFVWSADQGRWLVSFDEQTATNADGTVQLGPATVVIQWVRMPLSRFQDSTHTARCMETVGTGEATVLRDGEAFPVRWERPCAEAGTSYLRPETGERMPFARGQVWVVYAETAK